MTNQYETLTYELDRKKRMDIWFKLLLQILKDFINSENDKGLLTANMSIPLSYIDASWETNHWQDTVDVDYLPFTPNNDQIVSLVRTHKALSNYNGASYDVEELEYRINSQLHGNREGGISIDTFIQTNCLFKYLEILKSNNIVPRFEAEIYKGYHPAWNAYDKKTLIVADLPPQEDVVAIAHIKTSEDLWSFLSTHFVIYYYESVLGYELVDDKDQVLNIDEILELHLQFQGYTGEDLKKMKRLDIDLLAKTSLGNIFMDFFNKEFGTLFEYDDFSDLLGKRKLHARMEFIVQVFVEMSRIGRHVTLDLYQYEIDILNHLIETKINIGEDLNVEVKILHKVAMKEGFNRYGVMLSRK